MDQPKEITKIKLGTVLLDCTTAEEVSKTADVTDRPVEKGEDISDHMKTKPYSVRLSGTMVNDPEGKISTLEKMMADAELVEYIGKRKLKDMVITSFSTKQNKQVSNGYDWDISLKSIKIAKPISIKKQVKNPETKAPDKKVETKVKQVTNAGRKQMQNTANKNSNYTNRRSSGYSNRSQKIRADKTKPKTIMKKSSAQKVRVDLTNPGKARKKMLSTLTSGTKRRVTATVNRRNVYKNLLSPKPKKTSRRVFGSGGGGGR